MKPHQNFKVQTCYSSLPALLILVIVSMAPMGCLGVQKTTPKTIRKILPLSPPVEPEVMKRIVKKKGTNVVEREVSFYLDRKGQNVLHGQQIAYWEDGKKQEEVEYVHGNLQGRHTEWDGQGRIRLEGCWVGGRRMGMWTSWNSDDKATECIYINGKPVGKELYWRRLSERDEITRIFLSKGPLYVYREVLYDRKGMATELIGRYSDGKVALRGQYKRMRKHGAWTHWNRDGSVKAVGLWNRGRPWEGVCRVPRNTSGGYVAGVDDFVLFHRGRELNIVQCGKPDSSGWPETKFGENMPIKHSPGEVLVFPDPDLQRR